MTKQCEFCDAEIQPVNGRGGVEHLRTCGAPVCQQARRRHQKKRDATIRRLRDGAIKAAYDAYQPMFDKVSPETLKRLELKKDWPALRTRLDLPFSAAVDYVDSNSSWWELTRRKRLDIAVEATSIAFRARQESLDPLQCAADFPYARHEYSFHLPARVILDVLIGKDE